jgi:hypothetical protein
VFGDPVGSHTLEIVVRMLAFVLVIGAAALIPAPVRAALGDGTPEQERADHGHDRRDERYSEAHDAHGREDEAHDRDHAGGASRERELVGTALPTPSRGRST